MYFGLGPKNALKSYTHNMTSSVDITGVYHNVIKNLRHDFHEKHERQQIKSELLLCVFVVNYSFKISPPFYILHSIFLSELIF